MTRTIAAVGITVVALVAAAAPNKLVAQQTNSPNTPQTRPATSNPQSTALATNTTPSQNSSTAPSSPQTTAVSGRQSWTSDRRDFHVGDIVTILVDEYTLTSLDKEIDATDARQRDLGIDLTTPSATKSVGIGTNNNSTSKNSGSDARTNQVETQMSARVVEIGPNGVMRLQGTKLLNVEQTHINVTLSGWVRTQDVTPNNFVQSYRMADAKLDYQAEGPLGTPKSGLLGRILGKLWP